MLAERIARYVDDPDRGDFEALATAAFAELYESDGAYREWCTRAGVDPARVTGCGAIPVTPWPLEPWASRSVVTPLQRAAGERHFRASCLSDLGEPPLLVMTPATEATELLDRVGGPGSAAAATGDRIDIGTARSWLAARQRDGRAGVALASTAALERLLATLDRQDLRFQLPFASRVVLIDVQSELTAEASARLLAGCAERLSLEPGRLLRQWRWPGVPTPLYGELSAESAPPVNDVPAWMRLDEEAVLDLTITDRPFRLAR